MVKGDAKGGPKSRPGEKELQVFCNAAYRSVGMLAYVSASECT